MSPQIIDFKTNVNPILTEKKRGCGTFSRRFVPYDGSFSTPLNPFMFPKIKVETTK